MAQATVSVLFTDLVGSTELLERVGPDRAEQLRVEHFGALRGTMGDGREVKSLGDGLMVVFDSARGPELAAAVAMQQAIEARNRRGTDPLSVRMGLSSGEADVAEDDYFGVPVVEAARLCAGGGRRRDPGGRPGPGPGRRPGRVRLRGRRSAGPEGPHRPGRDVAVGVVAGADRGRPAPGSRAHRRRRRLRWPDPRAGQVACRGRGRRRRHAPGRCWWAASPGWARRRWSASFARRAADRPAVVLYGRSDEDLGVPYQPWREAIDHLVRHAPAEVLDAHAAARPGELASLAPSLGERLGQASASGGGPSGDGESDRYLLFGAVVDLLARTCEHAPVVLVLDDLHWADRQSLQLLRHVAAADATLRLVVLATFRDSELAAEHPLTDLLASLHREPDVERLSLRGLDPVELLELMEATAGHELDEEGVALRDALLAETEGNPFFAGEILRHLAETGAIRQGADGRWTSSGLLSAASLPVSVRAVVTGRVARLGDETHRVLSMASVIGRDFDLALLSRVVEVDEDRLVDLLEAACRAAVLQEAGPAGSFSFAHALIAHTLYDQQSSLRRTRAHQAIGEALEVLCRDQPGERVGELAYHWAQATQPQDLTKAITYARLAGDRALAVRAPDEAARWYGDALEQLDVQASPDPDGRAQVLVALG